MIIEREYESMTENLGGRRSFEAVAVHFEKEEGGEMLYVDSDPPAELAHVYSISDPLEALQALVALRKPQSTNALGKKELIKIINVSGP